MANATLPSVAPVHGMDPQLIFEKVIRTRVYDSRYWKEKCFALREDTVVDRVVELKAIGGTLGGMGFPSPFLCLVLKCLQIGPSKEIIIEYIRNEDFRHLRALGAFYLRLVGSAADVYRYLEPLYNDYQRLRVQTNDGSYIVLRMDEFIDDLLHEERVFDIHLPRLAARYMLEDSGELEPRRSTLEDLDPEAVDKLLSNDQPSEGLALEDAASAGVAGEQVLEETIVSQEVASATVVKTDEKTPLLEGKTGGSLRLKEPKKRERADSPQRSRSRSRSRSHSPHTRRHSSHRHRSRHSRSRTRSRSPRPHEHRSHDRRSRSPRHSSGHRTHTRSRTRSRSRSRDRHEYRSRDTYRGRERDYDRAGDRTNVNDVRRERDVSLAELFPSPPPRDPIHERSKSPAASKGEISEPRKRSRFDLPPQAAAQPIERDESGDYETGEIPSGDPEYSSESLLANMTADMEDVD